MPFPKNEQNLFIIDLHYSAPLEQIDLYLDPHVAFLETCYNSGHFIASGPKVPRTGGVILATAKDRQELEQILSQDPFHENKVATYKITEFRPSMLADAFAA